MIHWQLMETAPFVAIVDTSQSLIRILETNWELTSHSEQQVFTQPGQWIGINMLGANDHMELYIAAASEELFDDISRKLDIPLEIL